MKIRNRKPETEKRKSVTVAATLWFLVSGFWFSSYAKNNAYSQTAHGSKDTGPQRRLDRPRGSCVQCHDAHPGHDPATRRNTAGLFTQNTDDLCFTCHNIPSDDGVSPASATWSDSAHARAPQMTANGMTNRCAACHDPHGNRDRDGVIPSLLESRENVLCFTCHNGTRASDVSRDFDKTYRHPVGSIGKHKAGENTPAAFAAIPSSNRHVECSDCHNSHRIGANAAPPLAPEASTRLAGVSRVQVSNGGAAMVPNFTWRGGDDPSTPNEYEICFKCHSSFTTQKPGQANLAVLTNPENPSFHPIQAAGKNPRIDSGSFAGGVDATSIILCSDCHASDDPIRKGVHGSSYRYILKKPSTTTTGRRGMTADDICFQCHAYRVYGDASAAAADQNLSRFNAPAGAGHVFHVAIEQVPCYACHETHGSTLRPALIAARPGAITHFAETPLGGTCTSSCHAPKGYSINYPR